MKFAEVTKVIGLPDRVFPFVGAVHIIDGNKHSDFDFKLMDKTDIADAMSTIYNDSLACCSAMKDHWDNSLSIFSYENAEYFFHRYKLSIQFSKNTGLINFIYMDKGLFSKLDNGIIYADYGKLYLDTGITPVYTDSEIENAITKL